MDCRLLYPWDFPGKNTGVGCHSSSRASCWLKDWTKVSWLAGRFFTTEPPGKPYYRKIVCLFVKRYCTYLPRSAQILAPPNYSWLHCNVKFEWEMLIWAPDLRYMCMWWLCFSTLMGCGINRNKVNEASKSENSEYHVINTEEECFP